MSQRPPLEKTAAPLLAFAAPPTSVSHADRLAALQSYLPKGVDKKKPAETAFTAWDQYTEAENQTKKMFTTMPSGLMLNKLISMLKELRRYFVGLQGNKGQMLVYKFDAQVQVYDQELAALVMQGTYDREVTPQQFANLGNGIWSSLAEAKAEAVMILGGTKKEGGY